MAPVTATNVGMAPQVIDSPELKTLMDTLNAMEMKEGAEMRIMESLVETLEPFSTTAWRFEEQVDLYDWIPALNAVDASISYLLETYPHLLLIPPVPRDDDTKKKSSTFATCLDHVNSVPSRVTNALQVLLRFSSSLLRNCINKNVYNSVSELADLLGAANDDVASLALDALANLAIPPALHKQQAPNAPPFHSVAFFHPG
jgi:hypothetical protein